MYHRRERQSALEERVEALEAEKTKFDELNDKFVQELEKRDKAVEEAVAMIVMLEAKIDQFAKERSMVHQIEAEEHYANVDAYQMTPKSNVPDFLLEDDVRSLARMPSFLSERSENTENLRSVYLGVKGSMVSLPQVAEGSGDTDNPADRMASPAMSVLSESSFVSVYGRKGHPEVDEPLSLDGVDHLPEKAMGIRRPKTSLAKPAQPQNRSARSNSTSYPNGRPFQSMAHVVDGSPLQRIERMERSYPKKEERPQSRDKDAGIPFTGRNTKSPNHRRTRDEKREALRKVLTDASGGVRLHDHALPPTPDTISTSTLRRFQNSDDTLSKQHEITNKRSIGALSDLSALDEKVAEPPSGVLLEPEPAKPKARDREFFENRPPIQRPRSAGETTVSHRRDNDWDSDSDDSDARSLESSLDIWMRESAKPDRTGRGSPDLFSFPTNSSRGWAMDAMFGPSSSTYGSATVDPERLIEMFPPSAQPGLFPSNVPPPAPHRRSSLHAQTGGNSSTKDTPKAQKSSTKRSRGRRNSDDPQIGLKTPAQQPQTAPSSDHKKNHYPPIVGQQNGRNPLTKLFRRSLGAGSNASAESTPATVIEPTFADIPRSNTTIGVPSWVSRAAAEDDRESATPPPIMRKSHQGRGAPIDLEMSLPNQDFSTPSTATYTETTLEESSPRTVSATGHRRKWLSGFGRNNVKKST